MELLIGATGMVALASGMLEFHSGPVPLNLMLAGTNRNPIVSVQLPITRTNINHGCCLPVPLPRPPPGAQYALFVLTLEDPQRPGQMATMDFLELPLDTALPPAIQSFSINPTAGTVNLTVPTIAGRMYRVQASPDLGLQNSFFDVFFDLPGDGTDMNLTVPAESSHMFYRVVLEAQ